MHILLHLFVISLLTSNAVMGALTHIFALIASIDWVKRIKVTRRGSGFWPRLTHETVTRPWLDYALWGYVVAVTLGALFIADIPSLKDRWDVFAESKWVLFLYGLCATFLYRQTQVKVFLRTLQIVMSLVGVYAFLQTTLGIDWTHKDPDQYRMTANGFWRARGLFNNPMTFAYSVGMVFSGLLPFFLFRVYNKREHLLLSAALLASGVAVVCTFTRGSWIAISLQTVILLLAWQKKRGLRALAVVATVVGLIVLATPALRHRVQSFSSLESNSISQRFELWQSNWQMFLDHPLLGVGAHRNSARAAEYNLKLFGKVGFVNDSHNNVLQVLAGTGLIGFISLTIFMIGLLYATWLRFTKSEDPWSKSIHLGALGTQIFFHAGGLTQSNFVDAEVLTMLCFWLALSVSCKGGSTARTK